ncbi:hypothetical protein V493_02110 [Pseudogymnoascus sp. VKM F-4281 (FW-2241)]|nr:hypothetical protein V493_02110 [Pseudogymnoascus sp. VKM F-4281 (FW-2241)]
MSGLYYELEYLCLAMTSVLELKIAETIERKQWIEEGRGGGGRGGGGRGGGRRGGAEREMESKSKSRGILAEKGTSTSISISSAPNITRWSGTSLGDIHGEKKETLQELGQVDEQDFEPWTCTVIYWSQGPSTGWSPVSAYLDYLRICDDLNILPAPKPSARPHPILALTLGT